MFFFCFNIKSRVLAIIILFEECRLFQLYNRTYSYVTGKMSVSIMKTSVLKVKKNSQHIL